MVLPLKIKYTRDQIMERIDHLRNRLIEVEKSYDLAGEIQNDPLGLILPFEKNQDREVAALICAVFAYGNVRQIQNSLEKVFALLGPSPAEKLKNTSAREWKKLIPKTFKHRFNTADDLGILLTWMGCALREYGSLENLFIHSNSLSQSNSQSNPSEPIQDLASQLENFVVALTGFSCSPYPRPKSRGALFFFPKPSGKSACKRLLLFLRWVCGHGPMDLNIWKNPLRSELVIPVDTHVLRISRHLGFTKRTDNSWRTAVEITDALKRLDPQDPTRFDFALCHLGISRECPSRFNIKICGHCRMNDLCITYKKYSSKNSKNMVSLTPK
jgi:uncharacterized protein (TIGR02757 family)